jgi:hypothetical protein
MVLLVFCQVGQPTNSLMNIPFRVDVKMPSTGNPTEWESLVPLTSFTSRVDQQLFIEKFNTFLQYLFYFTYIFNLMLNEGANCTELSPSVGVPCFNILSFCAIKLFWHKKMFFSLFNQYPPKE